MVFFFPILSFRQNKNAEISIFQRFYFAFSDTLCIVHGKMISMSNFLKIGVSRTLTQISDDDSTKIIQFITKANCSGSDWNSLLLIVAKTLLKFGFPSFPLIGIPPFDMKYGFASAETSGCAKSITKSG